MNTKHHANKTNMLQIKRNANKTNMLTHSIDRLTPMPTHARLISGVIEFLSYMAKSILGDIDNEPLTTGQ